MAFKESILERVLAEVAKEGSSKGRIRHSFKFLDAILITFVLSLFILYTIT